MNNSNLTSLDLISSLSNFSAVATEAAIRRPIDDLVALSIRAAAKGNENTARSYQTAIGLFLQYLDEERGSMLPPELADQWRPFASTFKDRRRTIWVFRPAAVVLRMVDAGLLDSFAAWRSAKGDGSNTVATRLYAVRTFLSIAFRDNVLTAEQAQAMRIRPYQSRQKRDQQPVGRRLSPAEARSLRESVNTATVKGKRDLAMLDTMLFLGLRRDEVVRLTTRHFRRENASRWVTITGKGSKTRRLKVHPALEESITIWLEAAGLGWEEEDAPLFYSVNKGDRVSGQPVNAATVGRIVAEYGQLAGLAPRHGQNQLSAHDLRRTCARNAYNNSGNLLLVQAMLGHSDPKTTARYIGAFDDETTAVDFVRY